MTTEPHQTLYRPEFEHDACGIGALAALDGTRTIVAAPATERGEALVAAATA